MMLGAGVGALVTTGNGTEVGAGGSEAGAFALSAAVASVALWNTW